MSKFVISLFGSLGDLHPYIAVARSLNKRGHKSVIAAMDDYRSNVEGAGISFFSLRPNISEMGDYQDLIKKLFHRRNGVEFLIRHMVMPYLRTSYEQLSVVSQDADLLVSHPLSMALPLVAQKKGIPWVSTVLAPMSLMSDYDPPVIAAAPWLLNLRKLGYKPYRFLFGLLKEISRSWEKPWHDLRAELGLARSPYLAIFEGQFSPYGNLALFDPPLASPQSDWPFNTRVCGAPIFDGKYPENDAINNLQDFLSQGEAPIVFALGSSAVWIAGDFWNHAVKATQRLKKRAILITGPVVPENLPPEIRAFSYLPYSSVFPKAAAVVHQAGIGTLSQAMRSGRPQLLVPVAFDQPDNAKRAEAIGLGRVIPFHKVTEESLFTGLQNILGRPDYLRQAGWVSEELRGINGADRAAQELIAIQK